MEPIVITVESSSLWVVDEPLVWCVGIWLTCLGACFGSFLNVVIYRIPAGKSVVHPGSQCPRCGHAIRWYDNLPVISWLLLRARCRDCGTTIPVRYPLVEALVAALFAGLAVAEIFGDGANLPTGAVGDRSPEVLFGIYAYHLLLLVTLTAIAFIHFDGHVTPWKVVLPALLAGCAAPAIWPWLHTLPVWPGLGAVGGGWRWLIGLSGSAAGGVAGLSVALLAFPLATKRSGSGQPEFAGWGLAPDTVLVGVFLGWPAALAIGSITAVGYLLTMAAGRVVRPLQRVPWTGCLLVITVVWIVLWRPAFMPLTYLQWLKTEIAVYLGVVIVCASAVTRTIFSPGPAESESTTVE